MSFGWRVLTFFLLAWEKLVAGHPGATVVERHPGGLTVEFTLGDSPQHHSDTSSGTILCRRRGAFLTVCCFVDSGDDDLQPSGVFGNNEKQTREAVDLLMDLRSGKSEKTRRGWVG
jgi:hypothetical protein